MNRLSELGERIAEIQDRVLCENDHLEEVRQRIPRDVTPGLSRRRRTVLAAAALAAGIAMVTFFLMSSPRPLTIAVGEASDFEIGAWIAAPAAESLPIRFSDGSTVYLDPLSGARITSITAYGARVLLERGSAKVEIIPREDAEWRLDVGPFSVRVTGTRFHVGWSPGQEIFSLKMMSGSVLVSGPMVPRGRVLSAGETFRAWVGENRMEIVSPGEVLRDPAPDASTNTERDEPPEPIVSSQNTRRAAPKPAGPTAPLWQSLAREGRYDQALDAVQRMGIGRVLARSTAADILLLGDAARLAGRVGPATHAYNTARRRFPRSDAASMAAFSLGRMAFDQQRDFAQASRWLEVYLDEKPGGSLEREAMGRLIEAHNRAGASAKASSVARRYLARYPNGPHARYAKNALAETRE